MGKGANGALALLLLWIAFAAFFVSFHPGGLVLADGTAAQNPRDVIVWFMQRIAGGPNSMPTAPGTSGGT